MHTSRRDMGLDALRVAALFLMVAAHASRRFPATSLLNESLKFFAESAPAFFFFAFGLTFARFRSKSTTDKIALNLMFMYVGLAHNVFVRNSLVIVDFLFFLWLARVVVDAMGSLRNERAAYLTVAAGVMLLALAFPEMGVIDGVFTQVLAGRFPLFPWIVFVLLGAAYEQWAPARRQGVFIACCLIVVAIGSSAAAGPLGRTSLAIVKWPLTTPFILLFTGACILLVEGVRHVQGVVNANSRRYRILVHVSSNLLLATVLQYPALQVVRWAERHLEILQPMGDERAVLAAISFATLLCLLLLLPMLALVIALWDRCNGMLVFERLRSHRALVALCLLGCSALVSTELAHSFETADPLVLPWKIVSFIAMLYFTLELREWQFRKRAAVRA